MPVHPVAEASLVALLAAVPGAAANPLLAPWPGPHGGVPPFDQVKVEHIKPALEAGMAAQLEAIDKIATNPDPANFANTLAALERSDELLYRVGAVYGVFSTSLNTPDFQEVEREMAPVLARFQDKITQNEKLFARIASVYENREKAGLSPEQKRLTWLYYTNFVRAGARLDAAAKKRLSEINERLASLFTDFGQNVLADESERTLVLETEADLSGLPQSFRSALAAAGEARKEKGKWVVVNTRSSIEPFLTYSERRDLREKAWKMFVSRGDNGDARDNKKIITEILGLRAERAKLLGYATHAHWRLEDSMAKTPERAMELLEAVWKPAVARVAEEVADMQAIADKEGAGIRIAPWDYRYYAEKVRKAKYDLDENLLKPYLQLEKLKEALFFVAAETFGLHFTPVAGIPVFDPDMQVYEVKNGAGEHVGLWYFDPYARPIKRSGAWMTDYRRQERFDRKVTTLVSNNSNFVKAASGEPVLVSWKDAETLFHEFGHAVHGLSSSVTYPSLAGTSVARDYVELPSQLLERWLPTKEVLSRYALHHATGQPIPAELVARIEKASTFNQGFDTVEFLASALMDMKMHLAGSTPIDPAQFEKETLTALGLPSEIVMRHRPTQFAHIFSGDSYSAGYYSYLWADTLTADAFEAFLEAGGPYDKEVAGRFMKHVLSAGNTVDPADGYRAFRGKDAGIDALMRDRGFPVPEKK